MGVGRGKAREADSGPGVETPGYTWSSLRDWFCGL